MITLNKDQLRFRFPSLAPALRDLAREHERALLPRLLAEDREPAVRKLRDRFGMPAVHDHKIRRAERVIREANADQISSVVERLCERAVSQYLHNELNIGFQRTLRIPDRTETYPLPAGLGYFPLRDVDDYAERLPETWLERGGVLMPMYQSEALWINFSTSYPYVIKVAAGKINAVTGTLWDEGLTAKPQNYLVVPEQPWLDGFAVSKGIIRQFVAMPLGTGYSIEEQVTGKAEVGGLQLQVFPMRAESCFERLIERRMPHKFDDLVDELTKDLLPRERMHRCFSPAMSMPYVCEDRVEGMGLAAGGRMRQEIYADPYSVEDWDLTLRHRCFVHICNSMQWRQITGINPPHPPLTASEYQRYGVPWFDHYRDDLNALDGSSILDSAKSISQIDATKGDKVLTQNYDLHPELIVQTGNNRRPSNEVREWAL